MIALLSILSPLIASLSAFLKRDALPAPFKILLVQCLTALVCETLSVLTNIYLGWSTHWIFNIYLLIEAWLLLKLVSHYLRPNADFIPGIQIIISCVWFYLAAKQGIHTFFYPMAISLAFIYIILFAIVMYRNSKRQIPFFQMPETWLCISILIFFCGSLPVLSILKLSLSRETQVSKNIFLVVNILCVVRYLLASVSFLMLGNLDKRKSIALVWKT